MTATDESRVELEAERDFLLRSLDDLEGERAAGAIDDESYRQLHDDYTARAAAVIRALRDGIDARPAPTPTTGRRRLVTVAAIVGFAVVAAVALAAALGARLPGETSSGNAPQVASSNGEQPTRREVLEAAVEKSPDDVGARLALAQELEADGDLAGALVQYDEIVRLDPQNADAHAQAGRILYLTGKQLPAAQGAPLIERSLERLNRALEIDPEFSEARYFRAVVLAEEFQDFSAAQADLQRYLAAEPEGRFSDPARTLLAQVVQAQRPNGSDPTP